MKAKARHTLAALAFAPLSLKGQPTAARDKAAEESREILVITPSLFMPKETAEKIMWFYFWYNINGCGFPGEPVDEGEYWTSVPHVGYAGQAGGDPICLHKLTGRISWGQGPAFDSLKAMVKAATR